MSVLHSLLSLEKTHSVGGVVSHKARTCLLITTTELMKHLPSWAFFLSICLVKIDTHLMHISLFPGLICLDSFLPNKNK